MNDFSTGTVTERLYNDASQRLEKQVRSKINSVRAASSKLENADDSCTFQPNIGTASKNIAG